MLCLPFPYIANTAGWMTAEVGRQPWLVYGLMRTTAGYSLNVSAGNGLFTLLGFMGLYTVLTIFFLFLAKDHVLHRFTCLTLLKSNCNFVAKVTQNCNLIFFNC